MYFSKRCGGASEAAVGCDNEGAGGMDESGESRMGKWS